MKKVYIIFECDGNRSYSSYCIKLLTCNYREALKHFKEYKIKYPGLEGWIYNLACYKPTGEESSLGNLLRDFEILLTTENNYV